MTALTQALLFLSSYAPLLAVLGLLDTFGPGAPSIACAAAALAGAVLLPLLLLRARRLLPSSLAVESASPRDSDVLAYVASYLVPFAGVAADTDRQRLAMGVFILLIAVLYVRAELFHVNPLLALAGIRSYAVQTPGGTPVVLLCRRRFVPPGSSVRAVRISDYVYLERP